MKYHYKVYPIGFPLMSDEEQARAIEAWQQLLRALDKPVRISIVKRIEEMMLEDRSVKATVYDFYVSSQQRLDNLLAKAGLRYEPLLSDPPGLISPEASVFKPRYILCKGKVYRILTIYGLPPALRDGWLYEIMEYADEVRMLFQPIREHLAYKILRGKVRLLGAIVASESAGSRVDSSVKREYASAKELLSEVEERRGKLFAVRAAFVVSADSVAEAKERAMELRQELESRGFAVDEPAFMHWRIYELSEPLSIYTDDISLSTFFPFIATTLMETTGVFLGLSRLDESPVFLDIWTHKSYNVTVLGRFGSGKSAFAKKIIYEYSAREPNPEKLALFVIDRTGEYVPVMKAVGAQIVEVKRGEELGFDPFKLLPAEHAASFVAAYANLNAKQQAELSRLVARHRCIAKVYEEASQDLKDMLSGLLEGPLGWIFRGTPLDLSARCCIVLRDLGSPEAESLVGAMSLLAFIRKVKSLPRSTRKIVVVDEFLQVLQAFRAYDVMSWLMVFFRDARKLFTSIVCIAHDPRDLARTGYGRTIATQYSAIKVLFEHDYDAAVAAGEIFGLSESELGFITSTEEPGDCLLIAEDIRLPVHVELSKRELELVETRPTALASRALRERKCAGEEREEQYRPS